MSSPANKFSIRFHGTKFGWFPFKGEESLQMVLRDTKEYFLIFQTSKEYFLIFETSKEYFLIFSSFGLD